jgi:eukaryotic-like serine/threonine-protein kinase
MVTAESVAGAPVPHAAEPPPLRVGEILADSYVVRGVLGTGGMGQVYAADDLDLQRSVAVKTASAAATEQLRREAQALAQVHHRGVVTVFRFGVHRAMPFMVMERLYGTSLAELITSTAGLRPIDVAAAIDLLGGIAEGLAALHDAGIAHLDLKPGNVVLCASGRTVLVDLGIMVPEVTAAPRPPCGTPFYMAPELIEGTLAPGRARAADLYSFGALAHELLTGEPPFIAADITAVLACHLVDEPPDLRALRPDVPPRLAALVRACLEKDADDRPPCAEEIEWELRALREAHPRRRRPSTQR